MARERERLTPPGAAEKIGCSRTTVLRWEKDADAASGEYLLAAAKVYKVLPDWLAMRSDDDGYPWTGRVVEARGSAKAPRTAAAAIGVSGASQSVRLDIAKLTGLIELVESAVVDSRKPVSARLKARMIAALYADETGGAPDTRAVTTALATLLATLEDA